MAQLSSFATTASNVSVDSDTREITISSEIVEIDGSLDPPTGHSDWGGWTIRCTSSGGLRSTSGASGTLGGGRQSLKIIEETGAHRFGGDNYESGEDDDGADSRFAGDGTNVLKYHNIVWLIDTGGRSDFDVAVGSASDGSSGPKVEFSGVSLVQLTETGQTAHYNHYSGRASIRVHPQVGFGLRIENRTNGTGIEFSTAIQTGSVVEGLEVVNVASPTNWPNGARVAVRLAPLSLNGTMTLTRLSTPSVAAVNGGADKNLLLVDPVGLPTRGNWSDQYHGNFEIKRSVPFEFTGAQPSGETMHAIAAVGGQSASGAVSGASSSVRVRTHYSANGASGGAWSTQNQYRFFMTGLGFRKYSLTTTQTIANDPATITAALTPDVLPDGSAISSIASPSAQNPPSTLSGILRAIKDVEVLHPVTSGFPTTSLAYVHNGVLTINPGYSLILDSGESSLVSIGHGPLDPHIEVKTATTLGDSNGLTTLSATGTGRTITTDDVTEDADVFLLDSTGQKTNVTITNEMGASALFTLVKVSDGTTAGSVTIDTGSTGTIVIATKGLGAGYRLVAKRVGHEYLSVPVDLTGGGTRLITASAPRQILQPDGSPSYVSVADVDGLDIEDTSSGSTVAMRVGLGDNTFTATAVYKAIDDFLATASGAGYMGRGGQQVLYIKDSLDGDRLYLGANAKVRRHATQNANAAVRATLYANDGRPIDASRGEVRAIEGLTAQKFAEAILVDVDLDPDSAGAQSLYGQVAAIKSSVDALPAAPSAASVAAAVDSYPIWGASASAPVTDVQQSVFFIAASVGLANGDRVSVANAGDMTGLAEGDTLYAYIPSAGFAYLYTDRAASFVGNNDDRVMVSGGTPANLSLTFQKPVGTLGSVLGDIVADTGDLTGADFVEVGLDLREAQRILVAVLAGKLTISGEGGTLTFHRLDSAETAVIRADASDLGRTAPTRNPS